MNRSLRSLVLSACIAPAVFAADAPPHISGIYPGLAMFNNEGECGTGAVVPWADRLWVITYAPHAPTGSSDKLYEITPGLKQIVRPESIGGTPASRMIHKESGQLFIGHYAIDSQRNVRVIPISQMYGRVTGAARHLTDPAGKMMFATMEEGIYEVDVKSLSVTELWTDEHKKTGKHAGLPGYHGKGFYSTQGRYIYANNGDRAPQALKDPAVPSGALAEWDGKADRWNLVLRNQFTEVTGPGGIEGNADPAKDPVWTVGWDHRSLILMCLDGGQWHRYRLPKSSHSYDGAHGWNTEWPRIREIGEDSLLMTMHGAMWKFPRTFGAANTAGIAPRSNYLKVIGDFARWNDRVVFGCDDTAKNEFLNKRKAKGHLAGPQSQSNLWFLEPGQIDKLGPVLGRGGVWVDEDVAANTPSDAFLVSGYDKRGLHLAHATDAEATVAIEIDAKGDGAWKPLTSVKLKPKAHTWVDLAGAAGVWVRLSSDRPITKATAWFQFANEDRRPTEADAIFAGLPAADDAAVTGGFIRARGENKRTLSFAATSPAGDLGYYEMDDALRLARVDDAKAQDYTKKNTAIPAGVLSSDAASVIFTDDAGVRWRLPKGDAAFDKAGPLGDSRVCREVATERDLFNAHGTFYELPAENAGGFAKVRPVSTHNRRIHDYCSYRGLFLMSGISDAAPKDNPHIVRSDDGKAALWAGAIDDVWKLGKPRGQGGPWKDTAVKAGEASDPYLLTGYDRKTLAISHDSAEPVNVRVEIDLTGAGSWVEYKSFAVAAGKSVEFAFPAAFQAYWLRTSADRACKATAQLRYE